MKSTSYETVISGEELNNVSWRKIDPKPTKLGENYKVDLKVICQVPNDVPLIEGNKEME